MIHQSSSSFFIDKPLWNTSRLEEKNWRSTAIFPSTKGGLRLEAIIRFLHSIRPIFSVSQVLVVSTSRDSRAKILLFPFSVVRIRQKIIFPSSNLWNFYRYLIEINIARLGRKVGRLRKLPTHLCLDSRGISISPRFLFPLPFSTDPLRR